MFRSGFFAALRQAASCVFTLSIIAGVSATASAAVAVDGTSTSATGAGTNSVTFAKTVGAGSNRLLLVGISTKGNQNATSVTYGGVTMTLVARFQNTDWAELWRLVAPAAGTANVIVTLGGNANFSAGATSFTGVDQGMPLGAVVIGSGTSTTPSVTVSSRTGDIVFDVVLTKDTVSLAAGGSQASQWTALQGDYGGGSTQAGASSVTNSWTAGSSKAYVDIGVNVRAVGVNPGQFLSGSYTGNATDNTAISAQLGFEPDAVFIKGETTQEAVVRTATMNGDASKQLSNNKVLAANMIKSLDGISGLSQGGFTIGTDARVNSNTLTYDYVALTAKAGEVFIGSYIGNNTDNTSITGIGFQPAAVMVFGDYTDYAAYSTATMITDGAKGVQFDNHAGFTNCIQAMQSDGFQIGTDTSCNAADATYHYIAWKSVAGKFAEGKYTGVSAQDNRTISLTSGFGTPDWVIVGPTTTVDKAQKMAVTGQSTDTACYFRNIACAADAIQSLSSDAFQVGTTYNANGVVYYYLAFSRRSAATAVKLASFTVSRTDAGMLLKWRTGYEVDNLGFHVYREERGVRTRITPRLVGGGGLMVKPGVATTAALSYQWIDKDAPARGTDVTYWLEDVDLNGTKTMHGPIVPVGGSSKQTAAGSSLLPQPGARTSGSAAP